jgi:hypothetical protein
MPQQLYFVWQLMCAQLFTLEQTMRLNILADVEVPYLFMNMCSQTANRLVCRDHFNYGYDER